VKPGNDRPRVLSEPAKRSASPLEKVSPVKKPKVEETSAIRDPENEEEEEELEEIFAPNRGSLENLYDDLEDGSSSSEMGNYEGFAVHDDDDSDNDSDDSDEDMVVHERNSSETNSIDFREATSSPSSNSDLNEEVNQSDDEDDEDDEDGEDGEESSGGRRLGVLNPEEYLGVPFFADAAFDRDIVQVYDGHENKKTLVSVFFPDLGCFLFLFCFL